MSEPVPHADALRACSARIDRALPFTSVVTQGSDATVWFADVTSRARAGGDPLAPWRAALRAQQERLHGVPVPPHVPAAFVLQWWCEVAATPLAYAVRLGEGVVVPDPAGLGFELAAGPAPAPHRRRPGPALASSPRRWTSRRRRPRAGAEQALERARTAYLGLVEDVVRGFAPDVVMGSRQRWGVVDDMWRTAVRLADGAAGVAVGPAPQRVSCCFIYVLPGMRECASCPRGGRN